MARSTQYIGLTDRAKNWVSNNSISTENYEMTFGMFGETIEGCIYQLNNPYNSKCIWIVKEVVQMELWSAGAMIFTHLRITSTQSDPDADNLDLGTVLSWIIDPMLDIEVDYENGRIKLF